MTTAVDTEMAAAVLEVLSDLGTSATLNLVTRGTMAAASGVHAPDTVVTVTLKVSPPISMSTARAQAGSTGRAFGFSEAEVLATDLYVIAGTTDTAGATFATPSAKHDRLTVAGREYDVWNVSPIYSGDDVAAYELHLRAS